MSILKIILLVLWFACMVSFIILTIQRQRLLKEMEKDLLDLQERINKFIADIKEK